MKFKMRKDKDKEPQSKEIWLRSEDEGEVDVMMGSLYVCTFLTDGKLEMHGLGDQAPIGIRTNSRGEIKRKSLGGVI